MRISAVIVTRGDVDLQPVLASLPFGEVVVWDNSGTRRRITSGLASHVTDTKLVPDLEVYGRYAAISYCTGDVIYVQDDDVLLEPPDIHRLVKEYLRVGGLVCNMPPEFRHDFYRQHALVGFGAVFPRDLPEQAFERLARTHFHTAGEAPPWGPWLARYGPPSFRRTCDVAFTALTPYSLTALPKTNREFASNSNRMWRQAGHMQERQQMLELAIAAREEAAGARS